MLAIARDRRARGESVSVIAKHLGIGRSTLYRALEADEPVPAAQAPALPVPAEAGGSEEEVQDSTPPGLAVTLQPVVVDQQDDREVVPWTNNADPIRRPRWYTDAELAAVQLASTGDGGYWVIVAGERLGLV
ncbi:hypothetical protein GCM10022226_47040 [Sphaerisporangium flaviroseum]|uniref:Resolvase HTH domain-containing protein n=1 Tax=Sphaerisporangium flaviroseum TaxID=509199 RepID=A0ABP7ILL1_9ACTN